MEREASIDVDRAIAALWGKSGHDGRPEHLLLQHLYDALAVGELIWDRFLPQSVKAELDAATGDRGQQFFALLCGLHDIGKATPNFQSKVPDLGERVAAAGPAWGPELARIREGWHHTVAGAAILLAVGGDEAWDWVWPIIAGHHGKIPGYPEIKIGYDRKRMSAHSGGPRFSAYWTTAQTAVVAKIARAAGFRDLADAAPSAVIPVGQQLLLLGYLVMADWIASNQDIAGFTAIPDATDLSVTAARSRAEGGWRRLDLQSGWRAGDPPADIMGTRFNRVPRPLQLATIESAAAMDGPGLMVVEAPMGEGKTEAYLAAAEILAHRFGQRGMFVGLPTQAVSDAAFARIKQWRESAAPDTPIALLHGKNRFNPEFAAMLQAGEPDGGDTFGIDDPYGSDEPPVERGHSDVVGWFLGRYRGLLSPLAVGTIDNLLLAGTRTKWVMLRHAGLAGKVVILDEVHAASVYMSEFLIEVLRWLGSCGTPVILLTATLPPKMRETLVSAYLAGARVARDGPVPSGGYPSVTTACVVDGRARIEQQAATSWRSSISVHVRQIPYENEELDNERIVERLRHDLEDGGTALVYRNTVGRAQSTYRALTEAFPDEVELLHSRLIANDRAERTARELELLGPDDPRGRRPRHILVATQVAEQSFDVDVDLIISDSAPIDLLLQRIGRLFRHDRGERPKRVRVPTVVITGMTELTASVGPSFDPGSEAVYGRHALLRTAALLLGRQTFAIPRDVPDLVAEGYSSGAESIPAAWAEAAEGAAAAQAADDSSRRAMARQFLLARDRSQLDPTLAGLHRHGRSESDEDEQVALVRDGDPSVEVSLVVRDGDRYLTLNDREVSQSGVMSRDVAAFEEVLGSAVRIRVPKGVGIESFLTDLPQPDAWRNHPILDGIRVLCLDADREGRAGGRLYRYDRQLGLYEPRVGEDNREPLVL